MTVKMYDIYKTRYLYLTYDRDLLFLFESIDKLRADPTLDITSESPIIQSIFDAAKAAADITFDMAGVNMTSDISKRLKKAMYSKNIKFIDSADQGRNAYFLTALDRASTDLSQFVPMPDFKAGDKVAEYLPTFRKDVKYCLPTKDTALYINLAILLQIYRPSIQFTPLSYDVEYMQLVGAGISDEELSHYKEFYYVTSEGVNEVRLNAEGKFNDLKHGFVTIEEARGYGILVPGIFGKIRTCEVDCFKVLATRCMHNVGSFAAKKTYTLDSLLHNGGTTL